MIVIVCLFFLGYFDTNTLVIRLRRIFLYFWFEKVHQTGLFRFLILNGTGSTGLCLLRFLWSQHLLSFLYFLFHFSHICKMMSLHIHDHKLFNVGKRDLLHRVVSRVIRESHCSPMICM